MQTNILMHMIISICIHLLKFKEFHKNGLEGVAITNFFLPRISKGHNSALKPFGGKTGKCSHFFFYAKPMDQMSKIGAKMEEKSYKSSKRGITL